MSGGTSITSNPSFSTDLRISPTPNVDQTKYPDIYGDLQLIHFAIRSLQGYIDSFFTPIVQAKATEVISAGALVSLVIGTDGSIGVRNATNNVAGRECDAFALQNAVVGSAVECQTFGINEIVNGVVVGQRYYLGVGGAAVTTAPVGAGTLAQEIGIGITPNSYLFRPAKTVKQN
jgi:hypothetical protein